MSRILIVDDIAENRYLLESVLKGAGYEVTSVRNGAEALAAARENVPAVVIADILMPVMDGFELCRRWKGDGILQKVPFVFYTATYTDAKDEAFALSLGAERFLVKPVRSEALLQILREVEARPAVRAASDDTKVLEQYHEVLSHKLEHKVAQLENEIGARKRSEEALRASEVQYRRLFESASDGIVILDCADGTIIDANPLVEALTGHSREELIGRSVPDIGLFSDPSVLNVALEELRTGDHVRYDEVALLDAHGRPAYVELVGSAYAVNGTRFVQYNIRDITERKRAEEQAHFDAFHDGLTRLPNRALFIDRLAMAIARCKRDPEDRYGVLFIDLDHFKLVNDSLGHDLGDRLLVEIARRLGPALRDGDTLARWGGDEFAVLLEGIRDASDATRIAEHIQRELAVPIALESHDVYVSMSIGMALSSPAYEHPHEVLRDADTAMFRAKARGRGRYSLFDESMHAHAVARLKLESEMRRALDREEFRLRFQPIVRLADRTPIGFEALVRWQHPERGLLPPMTFIPAAEDTGLIVPLGRWVLREACRQMRSWIDSEGFDSRLSMNVNVASGQLAEPAFLGDVDRALEDFGLPTDRVKIEITESVLIEHDETATAALTGLRERGVDICMDDFGTGYSSLSNLLRYPIDVLKIDRGFVSRIRDGKEDAPIVGTILTLARKLGMGVVAEGVESEFQRARLLELECGEGQGFLFAEPLEADAAREFAPKRA